MEKPRIPNGADKEIAYIDGMSKLMSESVEGLGKEIGDKLKTKISEYMNSPEYDNPPPGGYHVIIDQIIDKIIEEENVPIEEKDAVVKSAYSLVDIYSALLRSKF